MKKLAVLIDADNISATHAGRLFKEIAKQGVASIKRAYGDWSSNRLQAWQNILLEYALEPVQQFAYTKGKNATDMMIAIDAMDLLHGDECDGFCLVSNDSDFTPLVSRIRKGGLVVFVFGQHNVSEALKLACDQFICLNSYGTDGSNRKVQARGNNHSTLNQAIKSIIYKAIRENADDDGWAFLGRVGSYISLHYDFEPNDYGYEKLSSMLRDIDGLQFCIDGSEMYCRKIPYTDIIKIVKDGFDKFCNKNGSASIKALSNYLRPRLDHRDYGFNNLTALLKTIHCITIQGDRVVWQQKD